MSAGELLRGPARLVFDGLPGRDDSKAFVFQHGMGGSTSQALGYVGDRPHRAVISLSARGHAPSSDVSVDSASFDVFADDVIALADHLGLDRFPVGGISLGAGTAINLATRYRDRVSALVLCRPAWLDGPLPSFNRAAYLEIAEILDALGRDGPDGEPTSTAAAAAADRYQASSTIYAEVAAASPSAAASLVGQIRRPRAASNSLLLRLLPADRPTASSDAWRSVDVPTLVIGHEDDRFHPYAVAQAYAEAVPGAELVTVPSKDADASTFARQIERALDVFLSRL